MLLTKLMNKPSLTSPSLSLSARCHINRPFFIWSLIYTFIFSVFLHEKESLVKPPVHDEFMMNARR